MTDPSDDVRVAAAEAEAARARLQQTLSDIQERLTPRNIARQAAQNIAERGSAAAQAGIDTARRNPAAVAGGAALVGVVLARKRLAALFRRATRRRPAS